MRQVLTPAALVVVLAVGLRADEKKPEADPDQRLLQGRWKLTYHEAAGQKDTIENLWEMTVTGDRYTLSADGTTTTGTIRLDSSKSPKVVEYTVEHDDDSETTYHGIYELNRDVFRTCDTQKGVDPLPSE